MAKKPKRKLTAAERRKRKEWRAAHQMIFINGKQRWVRRPPLIDGIDAELFYERNATPIEMHQDGRWDLLQAMADADAQPRPDDRPHKGKGQSHPGPWDDEIPF